LGLGLPPEVPSWGNMLSEERIYITRAPWLLIYPGMLIVLSVYPAGEDEIAGATSKNLCGSIRQRGAVDPIYAESIEEVPALLNELAQDNDLVITQGAGSVSKLVALLAEGGLGVAVEARSGSDLEVAP